MSLDKNASMVVSKWRENLSKSAPETSGKFTDREDILSPHAQAF